MQETQVHSLSQEDHLEEEVATHSSILAWRIPWTVEPGGLQSMGSKSRMLTDSAQATRIFGLDSSLSTGDTPSRATSCLFRVLCTCAQHDLTEYLQWIRASASFKGCRYWGLGKSGDVPCGHWSGAQEQKPNSPDSRSVGLYLSYMESW